MRQPRVTRLVTRLVISHVLVILVVIGVAGASLLSQSRRYFVAADRRALLVQARVAAASCDDICIQTHTASASVRSAQLPPAANVTQSQTNGPANLSVNGASQNQVSAALATDIRVVASADPRGDLSEPLTRALRGVESTSTRGDALIAAAPVRSNSGVLGAVEVRSTLRNVDSVLGDLRRQMAIALGVGALVAGALGFWRARSVARPIHRLTVAARSLATEGFGSAQPDHVLVMPRANDELAELTRAFVDMRGRVQRELDRRDAFVADASHELRTPLASIRGAVEILQDGGAERPEVRQRFLGLLQVETDRLLELVESLLSLDTATGHGGTATEQVDVQNLVDEVVHQLQPLASGQQIQLVAHRTEFSRPYIRGDVKKLRQLLENLIDNALAHAPTASTVSVTTSVIESAHSCRIDVVDDGPGIAAADRERVFDRFVRVDSARSRNSGGAGLGLAIARIIADAHGATIELLAGANERGTIARIEVPLFS